MTVTELLVVEVGYFVSHTEGKTERKVWENNVLLNTCIFVSKKNEVTEAWNRHHNEELCDLYSTPNIIQKVKMKTNETDWSYSTYGRDWRCMQSFGGEPWRTETTWKTWIQWENNINIGDGKWDAVMDWIYLHWDRAWWRVLVNVVRNVLFP